MALLVASVLLLLLPGTLPAQQRDLSLVVLVAVDQLRPDYFGRLAGRLTGGLRRFYDEGAFFEQGRQHHAMTETAPGHATMLSGRVPARTNIVSNELGVGDPASPVLGSPAAAGASPARFRGTTLYDWLIAADPEVRALSVSPKDRGAILPLGRARAHVYWYSRGRFSTSRYYAATLPDWVETFNARRSAERLAGTVWTPLLPDAEYDAPDDQPYERGGVQTGFPHPLPAEGEEVAAALGDFPWMDSITAEFALEGVVRLGLGRRSRPDLLSVSFTATDAVGHDFGPDSRELQDQLFRLDRWLGRFLDSLAVLVPAERTLLVLTSDHGVQSLPEWSRARGSAAERVSLDDFFQEAADALSRRHRVDFGLHFDGGLLTADTAALRARGVRVDSLAGTLAEVVRRRAGIRRVFTPASLRAAPAGDPEAVLWRNQLPPDLGWLLAAVIQPGSIWSSPGQTIAMHGSTAPLDQLVPIAFLGPGIRPRRIPRPVRTVDIAPTLAAMLGVRPTEPLDGRALPEVAGRGAEGRRTLPGAPPGR